MKYPESYEELVEYYQSEGALKRVRRKYVRIPFWKLLLPVLSDGFIDWLDDFDSRVEIKVAMAAVEGRDKEEVVEEYGLNEEELDKLVLRFNSSMYI